MLDIFLDYLIGASYKILTSYESDNGGEKYFSYLESLSSDVMGAFKTFPVLQSNKHYIKVANLVNYLMDAKIAHFKCRRLTFEIIAEIELAKFDFGGDLH